MKTELRIAEHTVLRGHNILEVWYDGRFIAQVCGADGPGVRVITKYGLDAKHVTDGTIEVLEVAINA